MSRLPKGSSRYAVLVILAGVLLLGITRFFFSDPEIALVLGEPWEQMRRRSSAPIDPAIPGHSWGRLAKFDAHLRFIDPEYGFTTPKARFFTVSFDRNERVRGIRMSPQVEPLVLDDTLKVVLDLQEQWRKGGWVPIRVRYDPPIENTPEWRTRLRERHSNSVSYWHAGQKYQIRLGVRRFQDDRRRDEERFLITLSLGKPWTQP